MKRILSSAMLAILLTVTAAPAIAQGYGYDTPLVIIRFNQRTVQYQQMLYGAVSKAVEVNPDVMFDLVTYAPGGDNANRNAQAAAARGNEVARSLQSMGVPASRISQRGESGSESGSPEVRIFVR